MKAAWHIPLVMLTVAASACSPAPLPIASSPDDPSNPRAQAGVAPHVAPAAPPASTAATTAMDAGSPAPSGHQHHGH